MSYQHERDEFISRAIKEGLTLDVVWKLLRYASTLHRLAEAQCNGDWPYNGDRDRPINNPTISAERNTEWREKWDKQYTVCPKCEASGVAKSSMKISSELTAPRSPEAKPWWKDQYVKVCPDCRTQELVNALLCTFWRCNSCNRIINNADLDKDGYCPNCSIKSVSRIIQPIFQGDPRGAVLILATPNYPWREDGSGGARGLYVPAR